MRARFGFFVVMTALMLSMSFPAHAGGGLTASPARYASGNYTAAREITSADRAIKRAWMGVFCGVGQCVGKKSKTSLMGYGRSIGTNSSFGRTRGSAVPYTAR